MKNSIIGLLKTLVLGLVITTSLLVSAGKEDAKSAQETQKSASSEQARLVNINTADLDELMTLPRIGPAIGQRIIDFRSEHGKFNTLEELMNVKGIGTKTFETLRPLIKL